MPDYDLLIRAGRVVCPATGIDIPGAAAIRDGRIAAVGAGADVDRTSRESIEFPDAVLLPGLIDLHAHPARSGSRFGVDPDRHLLARGTTTALSQGDAGADNIETYVRETIERSETRILLAINLSRDGEAGPGGCFEDLAAVDVPACAAAIERFNSHVWGLSVNVSHHCCGRTDPREVLRRGLRAADQTGLPLLVGLRRPEDWPLDQQLRELRSGDVVTYLLRRTPHCIVKNGRVLEAVREARARGIVFDLGHGRGSFDFETAEAALRDGFAPDTLSTDLQRGHVDQIPVHDLPLVMSKLRAAGMPEREVFQAVTSRPAQVLGRASEIGSLRVGSRADMTLLRWNEQQGLLFDTHENARSGGRWELVAAFGSGMRIGGTPHDVTQRRSGR